MTVVLSCEQSPPQRRPVAGPKLWRPPPSDGAATDDAPATRRCCLPVTRESSSETHDSARSVKSSGSTLEYTMQRRRGNVTGSVQSDSGLPFKCWTGRNRGFSRAIPAGRFTPHCPGEIVVLFFPENVHKTRKDTGPTVVPTKRKMSQNHI